MMYYPNIIACDYETYHDSKLSQDFFAKLPPQKLKGISSGIVVYEYAEGPRKAVAINQLPDPEFPIINREEEMNRVMEELKEVKHSKVMNTAEPRNGVRAVERKFVTRDKKYERATAANSGAERSTKDLDLFTGFRFSALSGAEA